MRLLLSTFLVALALSAQGATRYVPANDSQPLLRRDLLPLDVDAIRNLAENLAVLADGPTPATPFQLRHRAQLLTLSQRLSPAHPRARAIEAALISEDHRPKINPTETKAAKLEVLKTATWLTKLPADSEGHHLSLLLLDVLSPLAKEDPLLKNHDTSRPPDRWKGIIANQKDFRTRDTPAAPPTAAPSTQPTSNSPAPKEEPTRTFASTALLTEIPMIAKGLKKTDRATPELVKTSLVIIASGDANRESSLQFQPDPQIKTDELQKTIKRLFADENIAIPAGFNLNINTNNRLYLSANQDNLTAPIAMMLDAAISGRTLRRNTLFLADLHPDGSLGKASKAWDLLLDLASLRPANGSRLIIGPGMQEELTALLVMEKADFFTKYEVLEAPTFKEARQLFYSDGEPSPNLTSAIAGYEEVREKALEASNLLTFLSLSAVESRLVKARDFSPLHHSANLLATQAIRRPASLTRYMFAKELDRRLAKIASFQLPQGKAAERAIRTAYKQVREAIDPLERRLDREEIEILKDAINVVKEINNLGRDASTLYDNVDLVRASDLKTFKHNLETFRLKLRQLYKAPKKQ